MAGRDAHSSRLLGREQTGLDGDKVLSRLDKVRVISLHQHHGLLVCFIGLSHTGASSTPVYGSSGELPCDQL